MSSRGNAFKLSANMALGGGSEYGNADIDQIKNSLKLLKAKKNQRASEEQPNSYGYSGSSIPSSKNYGASKNDYNYEALSKNHLPGSTKEMGSNYNRGYGNQYSDPKSYNGNSRQQNYRDNDPYDYSNKPPSYPQQNVTRNNGIAKSVQQQPESYDYTPSYNNKNTGGRASNSKVNQPMQSHHYNTKNTQPSSYSNKTHSTQQSNSAQQRSQPQRGRQEQPKYYNDKEERSIKQVNRQNQVDIVEFDPSQLRPCRVCGRKFNPDSISKHQSNCKQVFQKKRKQFNAQQYRLVDAQQKKFMKKGEVVEQKIQAQQKNQKLPKWKAQSLAFRAALKQNRNQDVDPKEAALIQQAKQETGVKCPHCGRKFNDTAGPRHIKFCEEQTKKNQMKKKK